MASTVRRALLLAGLLGMSGVLLGALGAHGLDGFLQSAFIVDEGLLVKRLAQFETAARYQIFHAIALLAVPGLSAVISRRTLNVAIWGWGLGALFFSGSLYLLVLTNTPWLGAITPIGGVAFTVGWVAILVGGYRFHSFENEVE